MWACEDDVKLFSVEAHTNEAGNDPTYQWQLRISQDPDEWEDIVGETSADLSVSYTMANDNATYRCRVASVACSSQSVVSYTITQRVVHTEFTRQPAGPSGTLCVEPGGTAVLWVETTSTHPILYYQWWTDRSGSWEVVGGASTDTLTIENVDSTHQGNYYVRTILHDMLYCPIDSEHAFLQVGGCSGCPGPDGNMDGDLDVDLVDMAAFMECFGADVTLVPECVCADVDDNNFVELNDWALFDVTGP